MPNKYGVNFGISLSVWDYIFKTNYIPKDGRDIELGFNDENEFPHDFIKQGFIPKK
jgi:sterol desaturase/sphingolipid hydroxylase (fatty acid hydroxylase superfamily)